MLKYLFLILILIIAVRNAEADSSWKIHPVFDEEISHIVDTPKYVYFTSRNMAENKWNNTYFSLFRYDKAGDEIIALSTDNYLSGNNLTELIYNAEKGYLAIIYDDYNIDFLYNDGSLKNMPYYREANISYSKTVNGLTIEPSSDRLFLATNFGFVALNDRKGEISESVIYDSPLTSFTHSGNIYIVIKQGKLLYSPTEKAPKSIEEFKEFDIEGEPIALYPLRNNYCLVKFNDGNDSHIRMLKLNGDEINLGQKIEGPVYNVEYIKNGVTVASSDRIYKITEDGQLNFESLPEAYFHTPVSTSNFIDFWAAKLRKGLSGLKKTNDEWTITHDFVLPNAPAVSATTNFVSHPEKGLLVLSHGYTPVTSQLYQSIPLQISGYKNRLWINYAPAYTNHKYSGMLAMPNGIAVDLDNNSLVYITSPYHGILRLNLDNSDDIIHMSRENDPDATNDHFVTLVPQQEFLKDFANFSAPRFDADNNLWMNFADFDDNQNPNPHLYCWMREDRLSTTSSKNVKLPGKLEVDVEVTPSNTAFVVPVLKTGKGLLLHVANLYDESIVLIDTNGTPLDSSDDKIFKFSAFIDSDGNDLSLHQVRFAWEDPSSGLVWMGHQNGVCNFDPRKVLNGNYELNRVKVSRNDGTNLADYLLEGVTVNGMTEDAARRKWFATNGAGLICTSSDGREIIAEIMSSNSPLPSDVVYGIFFNPDSNSLMVSTEKGLAEYFLPKSDNKGKKTEVKAYPNPVRPGYSGYVKITDIPEGSLVKITDIAGNLIKDLGIMSGFEILWDLSDYNFKKVSGGIYHILVSPGINNTSFSSVGKILVVD